MCVWCVYVNLLCVCVCPGKSSLLSLLNAFESARMRVNRNLNYELEKIKKNFL